MQLKEFNDDLSKENMLIRHSNMNLDKIGKVNCELGD